MAVSRNDVMKALGAVPAPDGRGSIADSPQISDIFISDGRVSFAIQTTAERAASLETIRSAAANPALNWVVKLHPANVWKRRLEGQTG